ncbi:glycosyltransferase [Pseudarthrobacter sp. 1G09]|uniref:glycosyltransferase n=1 Tax=Pseudarthrobacter sp. 1G09 TaxID=3416178 RepID=UPI003CEE1553
MTNPRISIVTISYNQRDFLMRNIASVRGQAFPDYEHIFVDPGSTDGSRELITNMNDANHTTIFESDSGPADGLNRGFSKARGDVVLYLNSDDELAPNALRIIDELHSDNAEADVIIGNGWTIDYRGNPIKYIRSDKFTPVRHALSVGIVLQQATSFKRRLFSSGLSFNTTNPVNWDAEILYEAYSKHARFLRVNDTLGYFRLHAESITEGGRHEDLLRRERNRLRKVAIPYLPATITELVGVVPRTFKFLQNRAHLRLLNPKFPGLVGEIR